MQTHGNTVLITGGASGIGFALARAFLNAGNEVIICGRTPDKLNTALERLPNLRAFTCDVADPNDRQRLVDRITEHCPRLNVLVNNAAVAGLIDLRAPIQLTTALLPHLLRQREAAVVNITTAFAYVPAAAFPAYSAAKAGLHSFSQSLRHQLRETPVRVFEVVPLPAGTALNRSGEPKIAPERVADDVLRGMARNRPEIRVGQAQVLYLMARLLPRAAFALVNR